MNPLHLMAPELVALIQQTVADAVAAAMKPPPPSGPPLETAVRECLIAKATAGVRPTYLTSLRHYLVAFTRGRESVPIDAITSADLEEWFASRGEPAGGRSSNLGRLGALFSFARRRGWIDRSPCDGVERVRAHRSAPRILSVDECKKLLCECVIERPSALAWLVVPRPFHSRASVGLAHVGWLTASVRSGR